MLTFGTFIAPYHPVRESPLTTYERDLELIEWCDRWGFDEAWVGDERATAQPGGFYGGWVTDDVVGPFKGGPGTWGW